MWFTRWVSVGERAVSQLQKDQHGNPHHRGCRGGQQTTWTLTRKRFRETQSNMSDAIQAPGRSVGRSVGLDCLPGLQVSASKDVPVACSFALQKNMGFPSAGRMSFGIFRLDNLKTRKCQTQSVGFPNRAPVPKPVGRHTGRRAGPLPTCLSHCRSPHTSAHTKQVREHLGSRFFRFCIE